MNFINFKHPTDLNLEFPISLSYCVVKSLLYIRGQVGMAKMTVIIRVENAELTAAFHLGSLTIMSINVKHGIRNIVKMP